MVCITESVDVRSIAQGLFSKLRYMHSHAVCYATLQESYRPCTGLRDACIPRHWWSAASANHWLGICLIQFENLEHASSFLNPAVDFYRQFGMYPIPGKHASSYGDRQVQGVEARNFSAEVESFHIIRNYSFGARSLCFVHSLCETTD